MSNKLKITFEIYDHLYKLGLAEGRLSSNEIINELPNIWEKIKHLVPKEITYQQFLQLALQKRQEAEILQRMGFR